MKKGVKVGIDLGGDWKGYAQQLESLLSIPNASVGITVSGEDEHERGRSLLTVAIWQEQGFHHKDLGGELVGPRPVFGPTLSENANVYVNQLVRATRRAMKGDPRGAYPRLVGSMESLAARMERDVRARIKSNGHTGPPLADSTIAKKGHDIAWLDSGKLYDAIEGVVQIHAELLDSSDRKGAARFWRQRFVRVGNK